MHRSLAVLSLVLTLAIAASGSDGLTQPPPRLLKANSESVLAVPNFQSWGNAHCDDKGNIYFHASGDVNTGSILKIAPDGSKYSLYNTPAELSDKTWFVAFQVTASGEVWFLLQGQDGVARNVRIEPESKVVETIKLDLPSHLTLENSVVFSGGKEVLVRGYFTNFAEEALRGKAYVALFDMEGKLVKQLGSKFNNVRLDEIATKIHESSTTVGPDGNLYLLQAGKVLVVSPAGEVVKTIKFEKPEAAYFVSRLDVSGSFIALQLYKNVGTGKPYEARYLLLDRQSGDRVALYTPDSALGNGAVCFSADEGFTFERVRSGRLELITAPIR